MQTIDDIYQQPKFSVNEEQRLSFNFDKKGTISDMLFKIRKQRQLIPIIELNIYRVLFNRREAMYNFFLIAPDQYNKTDIYIKKSHLTTFFICSNIDPMVPLLQKYSPEEKKVRDEKCQNIINFVKRRDLDKSFDKTYNKKMNEVWRFVSSQPGFVAGIGGNSSPSNC